MIQNLENQSLLTFTEQLAAKAPVPGGGGAAALIGALASALAAMAGRYSIGKGSAHESELQDAVDSAERLRLRLLELVDADAEAFAPLAAAWKLPKDDAGRDEAIENATRNACLAPLQMARCCAALLPALETLSAHGSRMLRSDVGCAALACAAALECAGMNLLVNTRELPDGAAMERELDALTADALPRARQLAADVTASLRGSD